MRGQIGQPIGDVFISGYYESTDDIKDFSFSCNADVISNMIRRGVLHKTCNQNFERWSHSRVLVKVLIGRIVNILCYLVPVLAFVKQRATNAVDVKLK